MSDKETIEGNAVIATYMGWVKSPVHGWLRPGKKDTVTYTADDDLDFHLSWNELIPVFEKIEQYKFDDAEDEADYAFVRTFSNKMVRINRFQLFEAETLLEAAWQAAYDFIDWYNTKYVLVKANES